MSSIRPFAGVSLLLVGAGVLFAIGFIARIPVNAFGIHVFGINAFGEKTATTYYVSTTGSDENDGSEESPWATLQHAADEADIPGDIVLVANGAYTGFNSQHDGIVFRAGGDSAIIDLAGSYSGQDNINIENTDDVVVEGFIVRDAQRAGIRVVNAARVIVRNNRVGPNGKWGIFSGFAPGIQVLNNVAFGSDEEHGIYLSNSVDPADNVTIRGNRVFGNQLNGIQLNGDCMAGGDGTLDGGVIENNMVYENGAKGLSIISAPGVRIQNNVIFNNRQLGSGAAGIHLVDEPDCGNPTTDAVVVNNTIVEPLMAGIRINDGATGNLIFNNLIVSENPIADEVGGNTLVEATNVTAASENGLFADAVAGNYRSTLTSPAIDAGLSQFGNIHAPQLDLDGRSRDQGTAPDAGAYEKSDDASVPIERLATPVDRARLDPAFPNPFSLSTTLRFVSARGLPVQVQLFDTRGRLVKVLYGGTPAPQEVHEIVLDGTDLPSGLYHVRFEEDRGAFMSRPVMVVR
jgi:hypothetical protein